MTPPPRAVVFDVGNVLIDWQPTRLYERLVPDAAEREALFARVDFAAFNLEGDRGDLAEATAAAADRHPADAALVLAWRERWAEMFGPEIPGSPEIFRALKTSGIPLAALTNFARDTWLTAQESFPMLAEFDVEVVSGREGVIKPQAEIYALVESRLGLSGKDLFFTDDKLANVEAAAARGWRIHHFEGAEGLAAALRAQGLPV